MTGGDDAIAAFFGGGSTFGAWARGVGIVGDGRVIGALACAGAGACGTGAVALAGGVGGKDGAFVALIGLEG